MKCCIICENEIRRSNNASGKKVRRGDNCVTCGSYCARIYSLAYDYIYQKIKSKRK